LGASHAPALAGAKRSAASAGIGGVVEGASQAGQVSAGGVPKGVQLSAAADALDGLRDVSPEAASDWQRGDGGGLQDGVHGAPEALRDALEEGGRVGGAAAARASVERR